MSHRNPRTRLRRALGRLNRLLRKTRLKPARFSNSSSDQDHRQNGMTRKSQKSKGFHDHEAHCKHLQEAIWHLVHRSRRPQRRRDQDSKMSVFRYPIPYCTLMYPYVTLLNYLGGSSALLPIVSHGSDLTSAASPSLPRSVHAVPIPLCPPIHGTHCESRRASSIFGSGGCVT